MFSRKRILPDDPIFDLTWGIPQAFGGMTNVVLQRSSAFAALDRRTVEILTLAPELDPKKRKAALVREGKLSRRVRIRNIWADLRRMSDKDLRGVHGTVKKTLDVAPSLLPYSGAPESTRESDEGKTLQVARFRKDGTLLADDRRDIDTPGRLGGRRITLFDRTGRTTAQWTTARRFYHSWIDWLTDGRNSVIISDSSFAGGLMHDYRRNHVIVAQVLHNPHLRHPEGPLNGPPPSAKRDIVAHADGYDIVAPLTERQRIDMAETAITIDNARTISNMFTGEAISTPLPRNPTAGVMVSRLERQKRTEHAIEAMSRLKESSPETTLDIYGTGSHEESLKAEAEALGVSASVRLRGFDAHAKKRFLTASFSVLSSRFEGQPLVLLESMAAGCIPIAYDIRYGPSDIITHGVDGFLVPGGDVDALAETIEHVTSLGADELHQIRKSGIRRVQDFRPELVAERWSEVLTEARKKKQRVTTVEGTARLLSATAVADGVEVEAELNLHPDRTPETALLTWTGRNSNGYGRTRAHIANKAGPNVISGTLPYAGLINSRTRLLDIWADVIVEGNPGRLRIEAPDLDEPVGGEAAEIYTTKHGNLSARVARFGS